MASQETFLTVVAADALQATSCGINATCKCSLLREIVVPRFVCAISNCSKRLYKFLWHREIVSEICLCNQLLLQGFVLALFAPRPLTLRGLLQFATDITSLTKCRATALTQATALNQIQAGQTMNVLTIPRLRTTKPPLNRCLVLEKAPFPSPSASRPMPGLRSFAKMEQGLLKTGQNSVIAIGVANARRRSAPPLTPPCVVRRFQFHSM